MGTHVYNFQIRVLVYQEDGEYCAHALEMDLLRYGKSEKAAIRQLESLIEDQVTFARHKDDDSLLLFPAAKSFFERWETAHEAGLKHQVFPDKTVAMNVKAICITLDEALKKLPKSRFENVNLACA